MGDLQKVNQEDLKKPVLFDTNPDNIGTNLVAMVKQFEVMKPEDKQFMIENKERLQMVATKTFMWRTELEKRSIINDIQFPTLHAKFHQCILENSVFLNESIRLAKEFETTKLEAEELNLDVEELKAKQSELDPESIEYRKIDVQIRKKVVDLQEKTYTLQNMHTAMNYRMAEMKDWKQLEDDLINAMRERGYSDEQIWDKQFGQEESAFFLFLNKMIGIESSKDSGEIENLTSLAIFGVENAIRKGNFETYLKKCNNIQLEVLSRLGFIKLDNSSEGLKVTLLFDPINYKGLNNN